MFVRTNFSCQSACAGKLAGLACILLLATTGNALAGTVTVSEQSSRQNLTITAKDASLREILDKLAKGYGFKLEVKSQPSESAGWSTTLSGSIDSLLARLLRNQNHFVVRQGPGGRVSKVVLFSNGSSNAFSVREADPTRADWRRQPVKKLKAPAN